MNAGGVDKACKSHEKSDFGLSPFLLKRPHDRHLSRGLLRRKGLKVAGFEEDQKAQDLFLSVFHATTHTFNSTPAVKIIENHLGKSFVRMVNVVRPSKKQIDVLPFVTPVQMPVAPQEPTPKKKGAKGRKKSKRNR